MKTLLLVVAAAVTGCAVYTEPAYPPYDTVTPAPYALAPPAYFYGSAVYPYPVYPPVYSHFYPGRFHHFRSEVFPPHARRHDFHGPHRGRGLGGRDRDGDGVPNRFDRRPGNPSRR